MSQDFLPIGFDKLRTEKPYVNPGKLPEGEHRFRIVGRPIGGWIDWKDKKPYRYRPEAKPKASFDPNLPLKAFWALHVWDYAREGLFIMEITQNGIRKALEEYALNEDWGDLTLYDIKIKKQGSGKDTTYTVMPIPHKPMSASIKEAIESTKIRIEALYEGKDPWKDLDISYEETPKDPNSLTEEQCAQLDALMMQLSDDEADNLLDVLGLGSIHHIEAKDFDRVSRSIQKKIGGKPHGNAVA
jgi:hypothetical protein